MKDEYLSAGSQEQNGIIMSQNEVMSAANRKRKATLKRHREGRDSSLGNRNFRKLAVTESPKNVTIRIPFHSVRSGEWERREDTLGDFPVE
jgi:hypothetical protein